MYIPSPLRVPPYSAAAAAVADIHVDGSQVDSPVAPHRLPGELRRGAVAVRDAVDSANTRTGIIIGVVLGLFLVGACVFLFTYRNSVRCTRKKKRHRRHKSGSSKSSKSSKSSDGGVPPPPPPPAE